MARDAHQQMYRGHLHSGGFYLHLRGKNLCSGPLLSSRLEAEIGKATKQGLRPTFDMKVPFKRGLLQTW